MAVLSEVSIHNIRPNPYRGLDKYPYNEKKLTALQASIKDVGFWAGVIARPKDNHYELAFGHYRAEAARRCGLEKVPLLIQGLSDQEMLQFMARENMEDYNTDFLTLLGTWEAGDQYFRVAEISAKNKDLEIAKILGWTRWRSEKGRKDRQVLNDTADACNKAYTLIEGGHLSRDNLRDMSVFAVRELCAALTAKLKITGHARDRRQATRHSLEHIERAEQITVDSARRVAELVRRGEVATHWIRQELESDSYKRARAAKVKPKVMLDVFGNRLAARIEKLLCKDANAEGLSVIRDAMKHITEEKDARVVRRIKYELSELEDRSRGWREQLTLPNEKVDEKVVSLSKLLGKPTPEDKDLLPAPPRRVKKSGNDL